MITLRAMAVALSVVLLAAGCPGEDDDDEGSADGGTDATAAGVVGIYSCIATSGHCLEFIGPTFRTPLRRDVEQKACMMNSGRAQETVCTSEGRLGRCLRDQGAERERATHYYAGDVSTLQMQCARDGGLWTAM